MDTEYIVGSAVELGELTPLEAQALMDLPSAYWEVRRLIDNNLRMPDHFLRNVAQRAISELPTSLKYALAVRSIPSADFVVSAFKDRLVHGVKLIKQKDTTGEVTPFMELVGISNTFSSNNAPALNSPENMTESNVVAAIEACYERDIRQMEDDLEVIRESAAWYRGDSGVSFKQAEAELLSLKQQLTLPSSEDLSWTQTTVSEIRIKKTSLSSKSRSKAKSAIKKVSSLFKKFGWESTLKLVISGKEVELSNDDSPLKFKITPPKQEGWLERRTLTPVAHTPFDLAVYTKDDTFVARLCIYMEATPVLDQLLALSLYIKSGCEEDILAKANWFGTNIEVERVIVTRYPSLSIKFNKGTASGNMTNISHLLNTPEEREWDSYKGRVEAWVSSYLAPIVGPVRFTTLLGTSATSQSLSVRNA